MIPVRPASLVGSHSHVSLDLSDLNKGQLRQGPDGWHVVLNLRGVEHRVWFKEAPVVAVTYAVELPFDRDFEFRADAGRRLWRALNGRPPGAPLHALSESRRRRLALALRALDARMDGSTYREIAEVLFGAERISERDLADARSAQSDYSFGSERFRVDAWRLSRAAASTISEEITALLRVPKTSPLIFGIPLRGSAPPLCPSTRR